MKKNLCFLLIFLCPFLSNAQVNFLNFDSFDALLNQAKKEKKLIFIQLESDNCAQCNDVAMAGLSEKILKEKYATNFISTRIKNGDLVHTHLVRKLRIRENMGSFYLDTTNTILFKKSTTTSSGIVYLDWADKALDNIEKTANLRILEENYVKGDKTPAFLEKYIRALRALDRESDYVMNEYIRKLTVDSVASDKVIRFVFEQGLSLNAPAYKTVCSLSSTSKRDNVWYSIPESTRRLATNRTINQTFQEAVRGKNLTLFLCLNDYTRSNYGKNFRKGKFVGDVQMLNFYKAIKDTTAYFKSASELANSIISTHIDSLKSWEKQERDAGFANRENGMKTMTTVGNTDIIGRSQTFSHIPNQYPNELNTLAWNYYEMTNNSINLEEALIWSERSMAIAKELKATPFSENASYLDTYAHLLYKLKRYDEAIEWENKAIEAQKQMNIKPEGFEKERDKMINRKL